MEDRTYVVKIQTTSDYFVTFSWFREATSNFTYEKYTLYYYDFEEAQDYTITFFESITKPYYGTSEFFVSLDKNYIGIYSSLRGISYRSQS